MVLKDFFVDMIKHQLNLFIPIRGGGGGGGRKKWDNVHFSHQRVVFIKCLFC